MQGVHRMYTHKITKHANTEHAHVVRVRVKGCSNGAVCHIQSSLIATMFDCAVILSYLC